MRRTRGTAQTARIGPFVGLILVLAAAMALFNGTAHAGRSDMASCMPEMASPCCEEGDHAGRMHHAPAATPDAPAQACNDMDCAAMTACASPALAVLSPASLLLHMTPGRHAGPTDAAKAPLPPPALPKQPPRV